MAARPVTFEEFQRRMDEKFGPKFVLFEFRGMKYPCTFACPIHGMQTPKSPASVMILQGYGCVQCAYEARNEKRSLPVEEHLARIKALHGDKYTVVSLKADERQRVTVNCPEHGEFLMRLGDLERGEGCPKCARERLAPVNSVRMREINAARRQRKA